MAVSRRRRLRLLHRSRHPRHRLCRPPRRSRHPRRLARTPGRSSRRAIGRRGYAARHSSGIQLAGSRAQLAPSTRADAPRPNQIRVVVRIALLLLTSSRRRLPTPWRRSRFLRVNTPTASAVPLFLRARGGINPIRHNPRLSGGFNCFRPWRRPRPGSADQPPARGNADADPPGSSQWVDPVEPDWRRRCSTATLAGPVPAVG